jgi:hypothetical protein
VAVTAGSILIACAALATGPGPAHAALLYPQPFFEVGDATFGVAAADLNGDGLPDLLAGARRGYDGCAEILLGGTPSLLRSAGCLPVGGDPAAFAVADFDRDGHTDVAIGWWNSVYPAGGGVVVELGNGDGTFRETGRFPTDAPIGDLAAADFNGDGLQDLALIGVAAGEIAPYAAVLAGHGDGTFGQVLWEKRSGQPRRLAVADFDGDGAIDLALTDLAQEDVEIYLGSPSGALDLRAAYDAGVSPHQMAAADFDGDGRADLAVVNIQDSEIRTFEGLGNGQFQSKPGLLLGVLPGELAAGDFDGDGRIDLAVAQQGASRIFLLSNDGMGGLRIAEMVEASAGRMVTADFDDDGLADLAVASGTGVAVLRSLDGFAFPDNRTLSEGEVLRGAHARDFDLDGREDLAVYYPYTGDVYIYPGRSNGYFGYPHELESGNPPELLRSGDFNGDGLPDLVSVGYARAVFFLGLGGWQFGPAHVVILDYPVTPDATVADMNADGLDDLVVVTKPSLFQPQAYARIVLSQSDGSFSVSPPWDAGSNPQGVAVADFDADGDVDLAITNLVQVGAYNVGSLSLHINEGDLVFGGAVPIHSDGTVHGVATADLNGDALPDLVVAETPTGSNTGFLEIFLGAGGGTFTSGGRHAATRGPVPVIVRDVDGDGAHDLVTVGFGGGRVALLRGDGLGGFGPQETYATHLSFQSIAAGDFDGDGLADLALTSQNTTLSDGKVIVVPARPAFPCLPTPGAGGGQCTQDAVDIGITYPQGRGAAVVSWHTTHEFDVIGFNLIEYGPLGNPIRQNAVPIPCVACETGLEGDYSYPVARHRSGRNVFVEMLRRSGAPRLFGPASRE